MSKKLKEVKDDPRVQELANCVIFAINNFPNKLVFSEGKMESWQDWFKRAMVEAGYTLKEVEKEEK